MFATGCAAVKTVKVDRALFSTQGSGGAMPSDILGEPIIIRFDGLDAKNHEIELAALAESLAGLSRIIGASGHFAITQQVSLRRDLQTVRVVAKPPRDGCFIVETFLQFADQHPLIKEYAVQVLAPLTVLVVTYVFARAAGKKEEMKLLHASLDTAIKELGSRDQKTVDRLIDTIDVMAGRLKPSVKRAVAPIGGSARTLTVSAASVTERTVVDEADKAAMTSPAGLSVDEERTYTVLISELDMQTGTCHVDIEGDETGQRHLARITDPESSLPNNTYVLAMAAKEPLEVRAKATYRDEQIERLFISNHTGRPRGEPDFELA